MLIVAFVDWCVRIRFRPPLLLRFSDVEVAALKKAANARVKVWPFLAGTFPLGCFCSAPSTHGSHKNSSSVSRGNPWCSTLVRRIWLRTQCKGQDQKERCVPLHRATAPYHCTVPLHRTAHYATHRSRC